MNITTNYGQKYCVLGYETPNIHDHFTLGKKLGKGQWGTTYLCTEKRTGIEYACKRTPKCRLASNEDVKDLRSEIAIMQHLGGLVQNIVNINGTYEDYSYVYIVVDICYGGSLLDPVNRVGKGDERTAALIIQIVVGVVAECHSLGVMLRNIRLDNFMLSVKEYCFTLKAIDFGLAVFFEPGQVFTELVGSADFVAPEVLLKHYGPEVDVWSAGVVLYILLCGAPPFRGDTPEEIFDAVVRGYIDFDSDPWPLISYRAKDLISKMLRLKPSERLTAREVLTHPWITQMATNPTDFSRHRTAYRNEIDNSDADDYGGSRVEYQYPDKDESEYSTTSLEEHFQQSHHQQEPDYRFFQEVDLNSDAKTKCLGIAKKEEHPQYTIDPVNNSKAEKKSVTGEDGASGAANKCSVSASNAVQDAEKVSKEGTQHVETKTSFEIGSVNFGPYFNLKNLAFKRETYKKQ